MVLYIISIHNAFVSRLYFLAREATPRAIAREWSSADIAIRSEPKWPDKTVLKEPFYIVRNRLDGGAFPFDGNHLPRMLFVYR